MECDFEPSSISIPNPKTLESLDKNQQRRQQQTGNASDNNRGDNSSQMSNENMGKAVSTTAIPGTEISNNLIMSAWIRSIARGRRQWWWLFSLFFLCSSLRSSILFTSLCAMKWITRWHSFLMGGISHSWRLSTVLAAYWSWLMALWGTAGERVEMGEIKLMRRMMWIELLVSDEELGPSRRFSWTLDSIFYTRVYVKKYVDAFCFEIRLGTVVCKNKKTRNLSVLQKCFATRLGTAWVEQFSFQNGCPGWTGIRSLFQLCCYPKNVKIPSQNCSAPNETACMWTTTRAHHFIFNWQHMPTEQWRSILESRSAINLSVASDTQYDNSCSCISPQ